MIRPPQSKGAVFTEASDGDIQHDRRARKAVSSALGLSQDWATVSQVHGGEVARVTRPGPAGEADALWTSVPRLPLAVFTADCYGVVLQATGAVGVAHAGWRGATAGVVSRLADEMSSNGFLPSQAAIGPGIGSCCYEVGAEVSYLFPSNAGRTTWGSSSVDLTGSIVGQLEGVEIWTTARCTYHDSGWFSHRKSATSKRLAAIGWIP